jgi:RNA polymerase sigma-70 factor (ECF subfamily)
VIDGGRAGHGAVVSRVGLLTGENGLDAPEPRSSVEARLASVLAEHFDFVWQLLRRFGLPPADADDAAQHVFMILARHIEAIDSGKERAFLYGTTRRVFANVRRARRRRREEAHETVPDGAPSDASLPDELTEQRRAREFLDALMARLVEPLRRVLVLAEIEGLTVPEIAELEAIPLGTASSRLRRARDEFRTLLAAASGNPFGPVDR